MNEIGTPLAEADYIGATAHELNEKRAAAKIAAGVNQRTLFQRRGRIILHPDLLVLTGWSRRTAVHPAAAVHRSRRSTVDHTSIRPSDFSGDLRRHRTKISPKGRGQKALVYVLTGTSLT
ncbi:hypothetical protein [Streptomyces sp. HD]|uniref:hypothetical protein n=1 Tax=Streptomyces sp. HD TaxID=3020892 RepID=UPI00232E4385|nr:hypothetical protein [Streptomyces sp. HD]MDC0766745.1 hypothetical protein [Streptomyces sp. HD]